MALIKCPECKNNISDKAEKCPKCGYELSGNKNSSELSEKIKGKIDYKYVLIGLLIIVVGFYMLNQRNNTNTGSGGTGDNPTTNPSNPTTPVETTPGTNSGYVVYNDTNLGVSYEIPNSYKTFVGSDGLTYVGKNIDDQGALIPYILLCWDEGYNNPTQYLNAFTNELRKNYSDVTITIDMLSGNVGSYLVYGIQYMYTSSGHIVVDNRYVTVINNKIFMIGTREENTNSKEINDIVNVMFNTLKGGK